LAEQLDMPAAQILATAQGMIESGMIRRLGAVFDSRRLGYVSTLVAVKAPPERLDEIAAMASALPGVTHNYARRHAYNLWFTLTSASPAELEATLAELRARAGLSEIYSLPALAMYKSRVVFPMDGHPQSPDKPQAALESCAVRLDERQKKMVQVLQGSLPPTQEPFDLPARRIGVEPDALLDQARQWLAQGVIRRFGAVAAHRKLGFAANGMAVFAVGPQRLDEVGRRLAREQAISHVYTRPTLADWPYNLLAMTHGRSEQEVRQLVLRLAAESRIESYDVLFSTIEYKKTSMEFFTDESTD
jgi:DNA-binding Lrp family transcriptional regulator